MLRRRLVNGLYQSRWIMERGFSSQETTFGYRRVEPEEKPSLVGNVFSSVADRYDFMNDVMSCGVHRLWKNYYVSQIPLRPGMEHLDVAGGTGDVAFRVLDRLKRLGEGRIVVVDISPEMLRNGERRMAQGDGRFLEWVQADAEALPFEDGTFDSYSIAFGIRNTTHMDAVLKEALRVLKPGGHFSCLEFSHIQNPVLKRLYDFYSFNFIPLFGQVLAGDRASYQYLVESIRMFPKQEAFAEKIRAAGFLSVSYENLAMGGVAIHAGRKAS